jgi:hypothetical protein
LNLNTKDEGETLQNPQVYGESEIPLYSLDANNVRYTKRLRRQFGGCGTDA